MSHDIFKGILQRVEKRADIAIIGSRAFLSDNKHKIPKKFAVLWGVHCLIDWANCWFPRGRFNYL
ncbi:hypothetical protein Ciccas_010193 [Cichlidogyrus casuarinus]|uniref:Uncharacterized protein n=1 Tax=Cichlidogyrus casuarinus TaxID=1844966 RepID=A0ABD2PVL4_9PLAT